ncbi:flagellar basal body-associated protein FliL [Vampirovibrio sp.]|uniref:flagellar basal body-associated FliL family protein n=1 Tax=Vampirovibrio sp. TaxID=2717857 RepID=UPI0035932B3E
MARPTKPKDLKPKVEGEGGAPASPAAAGGGEGGLDLKFIIMVVVILVATIGGSIGSSYLMTTMFVVPELNKLAHAPAGGEAGADGHAPTGHDGASTETPGSEVGMNLELDEFMVNLKPDPNMAGSQYLRAKMALSVKVPEAQNCYAEHHALLVPVRGGKILGAAAPVDRTLLANGAEAGPSCEDVFKKNMSKYVPTVRDVVNASLMKRSATLLATLEGQESLKDEIKEQLTAIMAPDYQVLRVNFQDFIIQR